MAGKTTIEWATDSWNPIRGCGLVSPGCSNCYAMRQAHRFVGPGKPFDGLTRLTEHGPVWTGDVRLVPGALIRQCRQASVPCFVKQLGSNPRQPDGLVIGRRDPMRLKDRKGGDPSEWPHELRVREYPR